MITTYLKRVAGSLHTMERHDAVTRRGTQIQASVDRDLCDAVRVAKELENAERTSVAAVMTAIGTRSWQ